MNVELNKTEAILLAYFLINFFISGYRFGQSHSTKKYEIVADRILVLLYCAFGLFLELIPPIYNLFIWIKNTFQLRFFWLFFFTSRLDHPSISETNSLEDWNKERDANKLSKFICSYCVKLCRGREKASNKLREEPNIPDVNGSKE